MMVFLLASRHRVFDGWNIPLILVLFCGMMLLILLCSSFRLFRSAWRLKETDRRNSRQLLEPDPKKRESMSIESLWEQARGPFGGLRQQPLVQAVLIALTGFGLAALDPLSGLFGQ
jgi:hypothetical protein